MHKSPSFGKGVASTAITNVLLLTLGLGTGVLTARLLGASGRGELGAIQTWPNVLATLAVLGLPDALVFFCARYPTKAGGYLASASALTLLLCIPGIAIGYLAMPWLLSAQNSETISMARLYLLIMPIYATLGMVSPPLRGRKDFYAWNLLRFTPNLGWLFVLLLALGMNINRAPFLAEGYLVVLAILCIPAFLVAFRRIPGPFSPDMSLWQPMLRFGLPSVLGSAPQMLNMRLDQMLMAGLLPARDLGLYIVAVNWTSSVSPLITALGTVLFPKVASGDSPEARGRILAQGMRAAVVLVAVVCVGVAIITPLMLPLLFGKEFMASMPVAVVLIGGAGLTGMNLVMSEGLRGLGFPLKIFWAEMGGLVVTAGLLGLLLKPLGIMGAALASIFAYATVTVLLAAGVRKLTGLGFRALLWPRSSEIIELGGYLWRWLGFGIKQTGVIKSCPAENTMQAEVEDTQNISRNG